MPDEALVGPAGTGKSFVVGAIARGWTRADLVEGQPARRVFGLATSQIATDVLAAEGLTARNVARWLATQERLAVETAVEGPRPQAGDEGWRLHGGDLVVVDESAMTDTPALVAIQQRVEAAGAKLLLVGDHRQLSAVGAGGGMELLAAAGARYELAEARRFTAPWEREASLRLRVGDADVLRDYHEQGRLLDAGTRGQAEKSAARAWLADTLSGHRSLLLVEDNEQAARLSAQLRAELVRLGQVEEHGFALGMQGTFAGVGDVVQARRNGWELSGIEGNRRGPMNRETYRVTALRPDGGLDVTTALTDSDLAGERMVLPPSYVNEYLTLAYALTVHAAQGQSVDTSHSVVTSSTAPAAVYVAMSRGREANTAHVMTLSGAQDPAQGREHETLHRDPIAVLAGVLADADQAVPRSALATATESADERGSVRHAAELLADAAQMAATERTATWLDHLVDTGTLTPEIRGRIAADDGAASLARVLRRAELAGHDPQHVLTEAVADRPLNDARSPTNVIYSRITTQYDRRLDPIGTSWADWIPHTDNAEWKDYLTVLAAQADERAASLGRQSAAVEPAWAIEAFGAVPTDPADRGAWERRAGTVAGYRELRGHVDEVEALGPVPQPGQPEAYAAYRAAWRSLGRPEIDREELELSDGQLRMRVRGWERELAWAPRYVSNELAGTRQAADRHREIAALRAAETTTASPGDQERLQREAREAAALADTLEARAAELQQIDNARGAFLAHTAISRMKADRARAELALRYVDDAEPEPRVTAEEWLDAHDRAITDDERHLEVSESDVTTDEDRRTEQGVDDHVDIRELVATEAHAVSEDAVRVPSAEETAASIGGARRSLAEIRARDAADEQEAGERRAADLAHWHADEQAIVDDHTDEHALVRDY